MAKLFSRVKSFAKRRPSLFIASVIALIVAFFYFNIELLHKTSNPEFCGTCHKMEQSGPGAEYYSWEKNIHSIGGVGCIDCHGTPGIFGYLRAKMGGLYDLYYELTHSKASKMALLKDAYDNRTKAARIVPNVTCLFCHSDKENEDVRKTTIMSLFGLKMRTLDEVSDPSYREMYGLPDVMTEHVLGVEPNHALHVDKVKMNCVDCHTNVAHGGGLYNPTPMFYCFSCHDAEVEKGVASTAPENNDCTKCHTMTLQEQIGNFLVDKGVEHAEWIMPSLIGECAMCHVSLEELPNGQTCVGCHEDKYAGILTEIQAGFDQSKAAINPTWIELSGKLGTMNKEQIIKFAEFNYLMSFINKDGSRGIHNPDLMNNVFIRVNELAKEIKGTN